MFGACSACSARVRRVFGVCSACSARLRHVFGACSARVRVWRVFGTCSARVRHVFGACSARLRQKFAELRQKIEKNFSHGRSIENITSIIFQLKKVRDPSGSRPSLALTIEKLLKKAFQRY